MKLKTKAAIIGIACIFGASHYNDHLSLSVTFPSPSEVVDAVGKVADELRDPSDETGIRVEFSSNSIGQSFNPIYSESNNEVYWVRTEWNDYKNHIGAYNDLENAICNCPYGYFVFNSAGEIVYNPDCN